MYFIVKECYKSTARHIGIIGDLMLNLAIVVLISLNIFINNNINNENNFLCSIIICIISSLLVLSNFLGILFSYNNCCDNKSHNDDEIKKLLTSNHEPNTNPDVNTYIINNSNIPPSPIDTNLKDNNVNEPIYQPVNYTSNVLDESDSKPKDDFIKSQEGIDAPPSVQVYPQPQSVIDLPSEQDIISSEIPKEQ